MHVDIENICGSFCWKRPSTKKLLPA